MSPPLTPADLESHLASAGIAAEIVRLNEPTPTVARAAQVMGTSPGHIIKTMVFKVDDTTILVLAAGQARVDARLLAKAMDAKREAVRLATAVEVLNVTGYEVGGVPPLGHVQKHPVLVDESVPDQGPVYAGGGSDRALLRIEVADLVRATDGRRVPLMKRPASEDK